MPTFLMTTSSFATTDERVTRPMLKLQLVMFDSSAERRQSVIPFRQLELYLSEGELSTMFCCFPGRQVHSLLHANEFVFGKLGDLLPPSIPQEELSSIGERLVSYLKGIVPSVLLHGRDVLVQCQYHFLCIPSPPPIDILAVDEDVELVDGALIAGNINDSSTTATAATRRRRRRQVSNLARLRLLDSSVSSFPYSNNVEEEEEEEASSSCAICLEQYVEAQHLARVSCSHVFHWNCLVRWVITMKKNSCPLCRNDVIRL